LLTIKSLRTNALGSTLWITNAVIEAGYGAVESAIDSVSSIWTNFRAVSTNPTSGAVAGAVDWIARGAVLAQTVGAAVGAESAGAARFTAVGASPASRALAGAADGVAGGAVQTLALP
jgi:hypothetical protein